jgi:hypothetical protein
MRQDLVHAIYAGTSFNSIIENESLIVARQSQWPQSLFTVASQSFDWFSNPPLQPRRELTISDVVFPVGIQYEYFDDALETEIYIILDLNARRVKAPFVTPMTGYLLGNRPVSYDPVIYDAKQLQPMYNPMPLKENKDPLHSMVPHNRSQYPFFYFLSSQVATTPYSPTYNASTIRRIRTMKIGSMVETYHIGYIVLLSLSYDPNITQSKNLLVHIAERLGTETSVGTE